MADRGYYSGEEIKACNDAGIVPLAPKCLIDASGVCPLPGRLKICAR